MKPLILLGLIFELEVLHNMFVLVEVGSLSVASLLMLAAVCMQCALGVVSASKCKVKVAGITGLYLRGMTT